MNEIWGALERVLSPRGRELGVHVKKSLKVIGRLALRQKKYQVIF